MLTRLLERRLIVMLGKGGVGKSTLSASLAIAAAENGRRTLLMETDARSPIAATLGIAPSFAPARVSDRLFAMILDGARALDEYLTLVLPGRAVLRAVFSSRLYQFFVQAAPGLRELMMLGKVYYEVSRNDPGAQRWDLVILDAPASGHALSLLRMPTAARATFGNSIVGQEAENIRRMLHDRELCGLVEVATPETMAVAEAMETRRALASAGFHSAAIFLNRAFGVGFDSADLAAFERKARAVRRWHHLDHLLSIAKSELDRAAHTPQARSRILADSHTPLLEIPDCAGMHGKLLFDQLASFFASRLNGTDARHKAAGDDRTAVVRPEHRGRNGVV